MRVLKQELVVARKDHMCQSGLSVIRKGWTYERTTIVFDGEIYDWKQCMTCKEAMSESDRSTSLNEEEAYPEGWAKEDNVGCGYDN